MYFSFDTYLVILSAPCLMAEGESQRISSSLECSRCSRSFSNRRQILKHVCLREDKDLDEDDEEEEDRNGECRRNNMFSRKELSLWKIMLPYMVVGVCFSDPYAHSRVVNYTHKYSGNKLFETTF